MSESESARRTFELAGRVIRDERLRLGISLRNFCKKYELDWGTMSRVERGALLEPDTRKEKP